MIVEITLKGPNEGRRGLVIASHETHPKVPEDMMWVQFTTAPKNKDGCSNLKASPYRLGHLKVVK